MTDRNQTRVHIANGGDVHIKAGDGGVQGNGGNIEMVGVTIKGGDATVVEPSESRIAVRPAPSFLSHPLATWSLGIIGSIIVAFVVWYFGLK